MSISKMKYELSLWKDIVSEEVEDEKVLIFGSSEMEFLGKAINVVLKSNINGTSTLNFSLPARYFDYETNEMIDNDLTKFIWNESKVKLNYNGKWQTFIVKNIEESKNKKEILYNYSCQDLFINELSKTGWELVFSEDTHDGSSGTIDDLAKLVLNKEEVDWSYSTENIASGTLETKEEPLYKAIVKAGGASLVSIQNKEAISLKEKDVVWLFYSELDKGTGDVQVYYDKNITEDQVSIKEFKLLEEGDNYLIASDKFTCDREVSSYRANKIITNQESIYNSDLGRYVVKYKKDTGTTEYFGYSETDIITSATVQNLADYSPTFDNKGGWMAASTKTILEPKLTDTVYSLFCQNTSTSEPKEIINTGTVSRKVSFIKGEKYKIRLNYTGGGVVSAYVGIISLQENSNYTITPISNEITLTSEKYSELTLDKDSSKAYIIIKPTTLVSGMNITNIEFFPTVAPIGNPKDPEGNPIFITPDDIPDVQINTNTVIFHYDNKEITTDGIYVNEEIDNSGFTPVTTFNKIRSLREEKSNRFNLIQKIAELFDVYAEYQVEYNQNGAIKKDSKVVSFKTELGLKKDLGFVYGVNLVDVKRTINSDTLVTKMFVEKSDSEFAENGICSIELADENISKEKFLLNLDYYAKTGALEYTDILKDLYGMSSGDMAYLYNLGQINKKLEDYLLKIGPLETVIKELNEKNELVYKSGQETAAEEIRKLEEEKLQNPTKDRLDQIDEEIKRLNSIKAINASNEATTTTVIAANQEQLNTLNKEIEAKKEEKIELNKNFYKKYSRFLQEGVWSDSNYIDSNLYYLDAESTLKTSSKPQISYQINVLSLAGLVGYEDYTFNLADITYIQDKEFFGSNYKEPVIVTELEYNLDKPDQNKITIQNYNTQFEDLFDRISAATQSLEFNKSTYGRAKNFTEKNEIIASTLQNSLLNNSLILSSSKDQSVIIDDRGIEVSDMFNISNKLRLVSGGIFLSSDGGTTWQTGIKPTGINANFITAGQIDVSKINIMNGNVRTFSWNNNGITAYATNFDDDGIATTVNNSKFVRFDQHGLYLVNDSSFELPSKSPINYIKNNANVSITWDGFKLKTKDGAVDISTEEDIQVLGQEVDWFYDTTLKIWKQVSTLPDSPLRKIKIGKLYTEENLVRTAENDSTIKSEPFNKNVYGLSLDSAILQNGEFVEKNILTINNKGKMILNGYIEVFGGADNIISFGRQIGDVEEDFDFININSEGQNTFSVSNKGKLYAQQADITGNINATSGYFAGELRASSGYFDGEIGIGKKEYFEITPEYAKNTSEQLYYRKDSNNVYANCKYISYDADVGKFKVEVTEVAEEEGEITSTIDVDMLYIAAYTSGINPNGENSLWIGENFSVKADGTIIASNGNFSGTVNIDEGIVSGVLIIGDYNNGIIIDGTPNYEKIKFGENFIIDNKGKVTAEYITLGTGAKIKDYIELGQNAFIRAYNSNNTENNFIETVATTLNFDGKLTTSNIDIEKGVISKSLLIGSESEGIQINSIGTPYIQSSNFSEDFFSKGWKISNSGEAIFNNVRVRGEISSAIFKYEEIQTMSGQLLVTNSGKITNISKIKKFIIDNKTFSTNNGENYSFGHLENDRDFYFDIEGYSFNDGYYCIYKPSFKEEKGFKYYLKFENDIFSFMGEFYPTSEEDARKQLIGETIFYLGQTGEEKNNLLISINATDSGLVSSPKSITMSEFKSMGEEAPILKTKLVLGQLPLLENFGSIEGEYGLYCDNVFLEGAIISSDNNITSGINSKNANLGPVIWAGGSIGQIEQSPFRVYHDGKFHATQGFFKGEIEADKLTINSGWLVGKSGLNVTGSTQGILFHKDYFDDQERYIAEGTPYLEPRFGETINFIKTGESNYSTGSFDSYDNLSKKYRVWGENASGFQQIYVVDKIYFLPTSLPEINQNILYYNETNDSYELCLYRGLIDEYKFKVLINDEEQIKEKIYKLQRTMDIQSTGVKLWNGSDLEIYNSNNTIKYLYSDDVAKQLNVMNLKIFSESNNSLQLSEAKIGFNNNKFSIENKDSSLITSIESTELIKIEKDKTFFNNILEVGAEKINQELDLGEKVKIEIVSNGYNLIVLE